MCAVSGTEDPPLNEVSQGSAARRRFTEVGSHVLKLEQELEAESKENLGLPLAGPSGPGWDITSTFSRWVQPSTALL